MKPDPRRLRETLGNLADQLADRGLLPLVLLAVTGDDRLVTVGMPGIDAEKQKVVFERLKTADLQTLDPLPPGRN